MVIITGLASSETATVTLPAHRPGDFLFIVAFRDGSTTNPSVPAGWTTITITLDGSTCSASIGWKLATSAADSSGTWTNATALLCLCCRGMDPIGPVMQTSTSVGSTNTVTFAALTDATLLGAGGYLVMGFLQHRSTDTTINATPPAGMVTAHDRLGTTQDQAIYMARADTTWPSTNVTISGTASGWISVVLAVRPARAQTQDLFMHSSANPGNLSIGGIG